MKQASPPDPMVVHPLPSAPAFVGRVRELDQVRSLCSQGPGVVALVGLGGAGKTALAARFLDELIVPGRPDAAGGLFAWSFYQEPDAGQFLQEAHRYFADTGSPARGAGLLHLLREALADGRPHLLVLDGLERVQQSGEPFGRVEDPLLRGLLTRIAEGAGKAVALVTTRFPLTDLEPFREQGYRAIEVGGLDPEAAVDLLRCRGVRGDDAALDALVQSYGAHALTLDHLGSLIGQFLGGDPARAPEAPSLASPGGDRQALRLARLLRAYEDHLPPAELELLCRLCLLRSGVSVGQLVRLFACGPPVEARVAREIADHIARLPDPGRWPEEADLELADAARAAVEAAIAAGPLAGPPNDFPLEVVTAVRDVLAEPEEGIDEFIALYDGDGPDTPTDRRPLPEGDRDGIRFLIGAYRHLLQHPYSPVQQPKHHDALKKAFESLGWGVPKPSSPPKKPPRAPTTGSVLFTAYGWEAGPVPEDVSPENVAERFHRVKHRLGRLAQKHAALLRVRAACRLRQRKWALAGPLAPLDVTAVKQAVAALVDRHLVLREADGSVTVHPAVRDHFARRGDASGRGAWHDLIREQLVSLVRRPGRGLPEEKVGLDLVEEAIHHALEAGRDEEAAGMYRDGLGGLRHLGWKLGEMARGLRVLRAFRRCPDAWALGWFLRALGDFEEAYRANPLAYFRADVRLLQGRLPEVAAEKDSVRAAVAAFLMGDEVSHLPPDALGLAVPRVQLLLLQGRLHQAWREPQLDGLYGDIGWEADRARWRLLMAEVARRQADLALCKQFTDEASAWVLRSGSVEHLCLWHLVRARFERDCDDHRAARRAADEGVHAAAQSGLGLYLVLLLSARAEILLLDQAEAAEHSAREALALASAPSCNFRWGAAEAGHLLGRALILQMRFTEARVVLEETLLLRRRLGDLGAGQTQLLLERLP